MREIADPLFCKTNTHVQRTYGYNVHNQLCKHADWLDYECRQARNSYINALNSFNRFKCAETRLDMCSKETFYKRLIRKKKRLYELTKCRQIVNLRLQSQKISGDFSVKNAQLLED